MTHRTGPHLTTAVLIAAASIALAAERHQTAKRLERRLSRRDARLAAHAYALGAQNAEGYTKP